MLFLCKARVSFLLPLAGEGSQKDRMRAHTAYSYSKDPHPSPLPQAGEGTKDKRVFLGVIL
ncbi:MAG: hypothetical protein BGO43_14165 [Gammaproteobacteria bacterium 39-13]|nr:MAG: hypothetical protein BGO43_14165 [Gammaproteobacteria bacterium 39-13]